MIKDFNFSPGAKVKTFGLFNYTDKCGKLKEAINAPRSAKKNAKSVSRVPVAAMALNL